MAKSDMSAVELRHYYIQNSAIIAEGNEDALIIRFQGQLAHIPSIKNGKSQFIIKNKAGHVSGVGMALNSDTKAKLQAMDHLFKKTGCDVIFGKNHMHGALILADRSRDFDVDNAATSIKDWLEPVVKQVGQSKKKNRGYGIGVIENDFFVNIYAVKAVEVGFPTNETILILRKRSALMKNMREFVSCHFSGVSGAERFI